MDIEKLRAKMPLELLKELEGNLSAMTYGSIYHDDYAVICKLARHALEAAQGLIDKPLIEGGFEEALTPSGDTKAAYIGEFSFNDTREDADGEVRTYKMDVPWTTIKEIMKAIKLRALAAAPPALVKEGVVEALDRVQLWASQLDPSDPLAIDLDAVLELASFTLPAPVSVQEQKT